jgi:hypothetical protein
MCALAASRWRQLKLHSLMILQHFRGAFNHELFGPLLLPLRLASLAAVPPSRP